jgi:hypothetical protein
MILSKPSIHNLTEIPLINNYSKMKQTLIYMFVGILFLGFMSCDIGEDQPDRNLYAFSQPVSISPEKDEYLVGDIFNIEINVPGKTFQDINTGENISVGNARFALNTRMEVLQADPISEDSILFDFILQEGEAEENSDFDVSGEVSIKYGCPETDYVLQVGYQFISKGNYLLVLNDLDLPSLIIFSDDSDCSLQNTIPPPDNADQAFVSYFFESIDVNLEEFNEIANTGNDPNINYYQNLLETRSAYFFKVR